MWTEKPASTWPDQDEFARWKDALDGAAVRELDDRGVAESCVLTVAGSDSLRAHFGPITVPVAGPDAEVSNAAELFHVIDRWVAFERPDGPGVVLNRDRQFRTDHLAHLMSNRGLWDQAAQLVFQDVHATAGLDWSWEVVIHESAADFLGREGSELPWMEFQMTTVGRGIGSAASLEAAVDEIADIVQDEVIEETLAAWPPCPRHGHPLKPSNADWTCPSDGRKVAPGRSSRSAGRPAHSPVNKRDSLDKSGSLKESKRGREHPQSSLHSAEQRNIGYPFETRNLSHHPEPGGLVRSVRPEATAVMTRIAHAPNIDSPPVSFGTAPPLAQRTPPPSGGGVPVFGARPPDGAVNSGRS